MVTIDPLRTVKEIVAETPGAAHVFERLGIDYCCGGNRPLEDACVAAGIPLDEVVRSLGQAEQTAQQNEIDLGQWRRKTLSELVSYILDRYHGPARSDLARLEQLLITVCITHAQYRPELLRIESLFRLLNEELQSHMNKEEQVLLPYLLRLEEASTRRESIPPAFFGTIRNPIQVMMREHDSAGELLHQIREASSNYSLKSAECANVVNLYRGLEAFEEDLHRHIYLENFVLFPRALELEAARSGQPQEVLGPGPDTAG